MSEAGSCVIAIIGFSEMGQALARGLLEAGAASVAAYDLRFHDPDAGPTLRAKAEEIGASPRDSIGTAIEGADIVISAVTAGAAQAVAEEAARAIRPGQYFLDVNSISPAQKQEGAAAIEAAGGTYVEAAVVSPVGPYGHRVPMLLGGPGADRLAHLLRPLGMELEIAGAEIGVASAIKMCRSIVMKGLEALTLECLVTARCYGVERQVIASLDKSFPGFDWTARGAYMIGRVLAHGRRRAEEMRSAADAVRAAGLEPLMAEATAARQDWAADLPLEPAARQAPAGELDALLAALVAAHRARGSPG